MSIYNAFTDDIIKAPKVQANNPESFGKPVSEQEINYETSMHFHSRAFLHREGLGKSSGGGRK